MDRNALDWLFSTAPQAIAALVGLVAAGTSFIYGKIDSRIDADQTLAEIGEEAKKRIHKNLTRILWQTLAIVVLDLACLFLNPMEDGNVFSFTGDFSPYWTIVLLILMFNLAVLGQTVLFVWRSMSPTLVERTITSMAGKYKKDEARKSSGEVSVSDFIQHFIVFEKLLRHSDLFAERRNNYERPLSLSQMLWSLYNMQKINRKELSDLREINKIRNVVLHGGDILKIDKGMDCRLQEITEKLKGSL